MVLRCVHGEFHYAQVPPCRLSSLVYAVVSVGLFLLARAVNVPAFLGSLFVR